jgi:NTP pyrophosphatase (non-canonical NTP hydrolase)
MRDPLQDIMEERERQARKWGEQDHHDLYWLGILTEEVGEAAKALIENDQPAAEAELVQCAAVLVAWLECRRRRNYPPNGPLHSQEWSAAERRSK